ncbi:acyl-CoA thioesterase/bile acid-CoA:amino acid N-acyltransferase family protein [Kitasatospora sp. NPDC092948]|uniref:acyl-CoA thioesterase/bile acid-CoA:amino acid N-acyltransferase family protein n=1 Tax=Kitasatospora sp. NPDC092948 TaxID=3364088 RepID=UPI0037F40241
MVWTTRRALGVALAALLLTGATGCTPGSSRHHLVILTDEKDTLADRPVHLILAGLRQGQEVTVTAEAEDVTGIEWKSTGVYRADGNGNVGLDRDAPISGSYHRADGMGLFWSMLPTDNRTDTMFIPPSSPSTGTDFSIRVTATADGLEPAEHTVVRRWTADGVTRAALNVAADHVRGTLYLPPAGTPAKSPVLLFGGSEGGNSGDSAAALLASHGHPAMSVAYFGLPGLPSTLQNVPVEYAVGAARLLAERTGATAANGGIAVEGTSRGSELALLLAAQLPDLVRRVMVYAPSAEVNGGLPDGMAWTENGTPVPTGPIALDGIPASILAVAGESDRLWPSPRWARQIGTPTAARPNRQAVLYPGAGHVVGGFPYLPCGGTGAEIGAGTAAETLLGKPLELGGDAAANEAAHVDSWAKFLAFLDT